MAWWKVGLWALLLIAAGWFFYSIQSVLLPFALSWLIAVLLEPVVGWLCRKGWPRALSVAAILAVFFLSVGGLLAFTAPRVAGQLNELRFAFERLTEGLNEANEQQNHFLRWGPAASVEPSGPLDGIDKALEQLAPTLERVGLPSSRQAVFEQYIAPQRDNISQAIAGLFNGFVGIVAGAGSQVLLLFFMPIFVFFMLVDMEKLRVSWVRFVPPAWRDTLQSLLSEVGGVFKAYLRGQLLNVGLFIGLTALVLSITGAPFSLPLSLLAGCLFLIPAFGNWITTATLFLVIGFSGRSEGLFLQFDNPWTFAIACAAIFMICATIYDTLATPRVVGGALKLHPLTAMFVVFAGGALFGLPGMVGAYPVAGAIKTILARVMIFLDAPDANGGLPAVPARHRSTA
jgi:predicted PurR-regulated permease PerM